MNLTARAISAFLAFTSILVAAPMIVHNFHLGVRGGGDHWSSKFDHSYFQEADQSYPVRIVGVLGRAWGGGHVTIVETQTDYAGYRQLQTTVFWSGLLLLLAVLLVIFRLVQLIVRCIFAKPDIDDETV